MSAVKLYDDMSLEIENLNDSTMFVMYMKKLFQYGDLNDPAFDDLKKYCQEGGCEDLGIYMMYKYKDISLLNIDRMHIVMEKNNMLYDSMTPNGVSSVYDLPFFKEIEKGSLDNKLFKDPVSNIPVWYRRYYDEVVAELEAL